MTELRVTRPSLYPKDADLSTMEGHYIREATVEAGIAKAKAKFPNEPLVAVAWDKSIFKKVVLDEREIPAPTK